MWLLGLIMDSFLYVSSRETEVYKWIDWIWWDFMESSIGIGDNRSRLMVLSLGRAMLTLLYSLSYNDTRLIDPSFSYCYKYSYIKPDMKSFLKFGSVKSLSDSWIAIDTDF